MSKINFVLRIEPDVIDKVKDRAEECGITSAEYIREAIDRYLENDTYDEPTKEMIEDMDWDELEEAIDEYDLEIDANDYDNSGLFGSPSAEDTEDLREAVLDEFGLLEDEYEE